jgi:hypothetical protein
MNKIKMIAFTLFFLLNIVFSHPTTFKSGRILWYVKNNSMEDLRLGYSIRHNWLVGGRILKTPMNEDLMINSNWLLKRWNKVGSQANMYILSNLSFNKKYHLGLQGDWENRRWYIAQMIDYYDGEQSYEMRLGFSPYLIDFNGLSTWFIIQNINGSIKPIIRLFKDNYLVEFGSKNGNNYLTLMVHF